MMHKKPIWNDNPFDQWSEEELLCMEKESICYGKGGGSAPPPQPSSTTQTTTSEFPTELRPFVSDIFEKSQAVQEQRQAEGFQPELTQQLASFTPEQEQSFAQIQNLQGQTQPLFDEATALARQSGRSATDPAEIAALMNPFLRNVTDIQKREAERVGDVQEQQLAAQAAQAGAFGGSRAAILEAERQRNLNQQLGDIEAQGLAASFQNAQSQLQNQFGREAGSAAQLGALGSAIPAQQLKEIGALSGIGAARQQQSQRALDIATQQAREEFGFPMATLQDFSSILRGFPLPATQNVSRQSFSPAQPLSTQLLGLGTGLAGLAGAAGAFKKAGGLVGAPVRMQNGGYVKLAGGGGLGEMMQGKVKKYAEGGSTQIELLSQYTLKELEQLLNNPARAVELGFSPTLIKAELDKKVAGRGSVQDAARASAQSQFTEGVGKVPGQIVEAAQALPDQLQSLGEAGARAAQTVAPYIPRSGGFADEASALADQTAAGLESFMTRDGEKLGGGDVRRMDPTGMLSVNRIPASSPLLSAPQGMMAEEIVASGPQGMMAEEIVTSPAGPSISGLTPRTGVPPLMSAMESMDVGIAPGGAPVSPPNLMSAAPASPAPALRGEPSVLLGSYDPLPRGMVQQVGGPQEMDMVEEMALPPSPSFLESFGTGPDASKFTSDIRGGVLSLGENLERMRNKKKGYEPVTPLGDVINYFRSKENVDKSEINTNPLLQPQTELLSAKFDPVKDKEFISIDPDPGAGSSALTTAAPAGPAAPELVPPELTTVEPSNKNTEKARKNLLQIPKFEDIETTFDIDKYEKDYASIEGKDFMGEVRSKIGEVPILEKRKEFNAHPRISAMLIKAAGAILGSTKGPIEAMSGAFNVIGKDMTELADARVKNEEAARQERNQDLTRKYNQKAKFYAAGESAKAKALQSLTSVSQTRQKYDDGEINKQTAQVSMIKNINAMTMADYNFAQQQVDQLMKENGEIYLGDLRATRNRNNLSLNTTMAAAIGRGGPLLGQDAKIAIKNIAIKQDLDLLQSVYGKVRDGDNFYDVGPEIAKLKAMLKGPSQNDQVGKETLLPSTSTGGSVTATNRGGTGVSG